MVKKYKKLPDYGLYEGLGIATTGIGLAVGGQVLGDIGGTAAAYGQQAVGKFSKGLPAVGSIGATGVLFNTLKKLKKSSKV